MNVMRGLNLAWTPWSLFISVVVLIVVMMLGYVSWRRRGFRRGDGVLELLRLAIVAVGCLLLNQPEFTEQYLPSEKPTVAIVCDQSPSMQTKDVVDGEAGSIASRLAAAESMSDSQTWQSLGDVLNIEIRQFGQDDGQSNLFQSLHRTLQQTERLRGIVLVSDGDWNDGPPPVEVATQLRMSGIPVFSIPVGSPTRLPDLELVSLDTPAFGVAGKTVRIPYSVDSSLPREKTRTVLLRADNGDEVQTEIQVKPMGRTNGTVLWKPSGTGDVMLTLELQQHAEETQADNNSLQAPISIREEKLKVLLVESYPRWEYRYLRNALSRDPGVELSCLLFHPVLKAVGGGNKDYIKSFPSEIEELGQFDVVFLGDVGIEQGQLSEEDCRLLKGIVEYQASGLVFMPGWQGRQVSLLESELADLYPVIMDATQPEGWGSRTASHFELTQAGQRSLLTRLTNGEEENLSVWESLPGFQWYAAVEQAKPGSEVLCVHRDMTNEFGRIPLLATRTYGAGKILFMGTDGAWRWRKGVEDLYHYRFWGQVVRWMAYQRNMAKGERMRLYYSPDQPFLDKTVTLNANVMEDSGEPLQQGDVVARIVAPSGTSETVRFQSSGDEWGAFAGQFTPVEPGQHLITIACKQTSATLEAAIYVQGSAEERPGRSARPEVLRELAQVSGGQTLSLDETEKILAALKSIPEPPPAVRRVQLWAHPLAGGLFMLLLGCFWVGRKAVGLI
jgi:hypothetical protein